MKLVARCSCALRWCSSPPHLFLKFVVGKKSGDRTTVTTVYLLHFSPNTHYQPCRRKDEQLHGWAVRRLPGVIPGLRIRSQGLAAAPLKRTNKFSRYYVNVTKGTVIVIKLKHSSFLSFKLSPELHYCDTEVNDSKSSSGNVKRTTRCNT